MNEHIDKLLKQATYDVLGVKQVDQKKFAELIIKECAEVLDTWNKENGAEEGLDKAGLISLWSPHFGVEE